MKRIICLIIALCLVFGSFSFSFAAVQDVSDATTHTQLGNIYNLLNGTNFSGRLANIYNKLDDINANLVTLMGWLDPSSGGGTTALLNQILNALTYTDVGGGVVSFLLDIKNNGTQTVTKLTNLYDSLSIGLTNKYLNSVSLTQDQIRQNAHYALIPNNSASYNILSIDPNHFGQVTTIPVNWTRGSPIGNVALILANMMGNQTYSYNGFLNYGLNGYNATQTTTNWGNLGSSTFTPVSATDGIYKWLSAIQTPISRLSYVLASDADIEAREAATLNQEAVVDNFIDSTGDGSASPSDIGSISDLSSGYKSNFSTDANASDFFDIFDSEHFGWFSQETANSLDTTTPTRRGYSFDTPLLDNQIDNIYDALGVKHD